LTCPVSGLVRAYDGVYKKGERRKPGCSVPSTISTLAETLKSTLYIPVNFVSRVGGYMALLARFATLEIKGKLFLMMALAHNGRGIQNITEDRRSTLEDIRNKVLQIYREYISPQAAFPGKGSSPFEFITIIIS